MNNPVQTLNVKGPAGHLSVRAQGDPAGPAVLMAHSICSSSTMWEAQAEWLAARGYRVLRADTRGHGASDAPPAPYSMADLVADHVAVLDALGIERAHYIGLSLGAMSGFGLGISHADRLLSLVLCDGRADMPPAAAAPWPERIAMAREHGCAALADSTVERWFGKAFVDSNPAVAQRFRDTVAATSVDGFVGSAQAIMALDYLSQVDRIQTPTTLIVGANDGPLPQAMRDLSTRIAGSVYELIEGAGHLPNIDQTAAFDAALLRHLQRIDGARA